MWLNGGTNFQCCSCLYFIHVSLIMVTITSNVFHSYLSTEYNLPWVMSQKLWKQRKNRTRLLLLELIRTCLYILFTILDINIIRESFFVVIVASSGSLNFFFKIRSGWIQASPKLNNISPMLRSLSVIWNMVSKIQIIDKVFHNCDAIKQNESEVKKKMIFSFLAFTIRALFRL